MASPITAEDFPVISPSGATCDQLLETFALSARLRTFFTWLLNSDGTLSDEFKALLAEAVLPVGMVVWRPVSSIPQGFLLCNGQSVSRTTYSALFAVIGTKYGSESDETFKVPDLQNRYLLGSGITSPGDLVGANEVTLTEDQLAAHTHEITNHVSAINDSGAGQRAFNDGGRPQPVADIVTETESAGGGQAHENRPASMSGLHLIRY